ncbi:MAG TPA: hypothetical protein VMT38_01450 [Terracidiphilus sp.]|nr:hypothetical protein [Terracidiphilus sp.]
MNAIDSLLAGLIDYAGLYPPARLDMHTATQKYLEYGQGTHAQALGRFVIDLDQFPPLCDTAGDSIRGMRFSVIASPGANWDHLQRLMDKGYAIEAVEVKADGAAEVARVAAQIPAGITLYVEVPVQGTTAETLDAVAAAGLRVKLRMGGVSAESIPSPRAIASMLGELSRRRMVFKATAGLHHPVRGRHTLDYSSESPTAVMHGFVNVACAATLLHFGCEADEAMEVLEEGCSSEWRVTPDSIGWRKNSWSADELGEMRQHFFAGFGSCSFEEPIRELEALGWL